MPAYIVKDLPIDKQTTITYEKTSKDAVKVETSIYVTKYRYANPGDPDDFVFPAFPYIPEAKILENRSVSTQSGQLPGPKKVGPNRTSDSEKYDRYKIHVNTKGEDVNVDSDVLDLEQLKVIGKEIARENKATAYRFSARHIPMPWLKKGDRFKIGNIITDGQGNSYTCPAYFVITNLTLELNENSFLANIEALGWQLGGEGGGFGINPS